MIRSPFPARPAAGSVLTLAVLLLACGSADGGDAPSDATVASDVPATGAPRSDRDGADGSAAAPDRRNPAPATAWVVFGADTVVAEVARTADERAQGLMYRDVLPDGTGMLFVFDRAETRSFWMKNTFIPLDIAFMDASYRVVDIQTMAPESEEYHHSAAPALFALEVRAGWFAEHGVEVGDVAEIVFGG